MDRSLWSRPMTRQRGTALTVAAVLFGALAVSNLLKPLELNASHGFVFFGHRLHGIANVIAGPLFGLYLAAYAAGIWGLRRWALPMGVAYAGYVIVNLLSFAAWGPVEPGSRRTAVRPGLHDRRHRGVRGHRLAAGAAPRRSGVACQPGSESRCSGRGSRVHISTSPATTCGRAWWRASVPTSFAACTRWSCWCGSAGWSGTGGTTSTRARSCGRPSDRRSWLAR